MKGMFLVFVASLFLLIGVFNANAYEAVTGPVNSTIHWTKLVQPKPNSLLQGVVTIEVVKNENAGVELGHVDIYFNQELLQSFSYPPYLFNWDTSSTSIPGGCILINAFDQEGNMDEPVCYPVLIRKPEY